MFARLMVHVDLERVLSEVAFAIFSDCSEADSLRWVRVGLVSNVYLGFQADEATDGLLRELVIEVEMH